MLIPKMRLYIGFVAFFTMTYDYDHDHCPIGVGLAGFIKVNYLFKKSLQAQFSRESSHGHGQWSWSPVK